MSIKQRIQEHLHRQQLSAYEAELAGQKEGYVRHLRTGDLHIPAGEAYEKKKGGCRLLNTEALSSELGKRGLRKAGSSEPDERGLRKACSSESDESGLQKACSSKTQEGGEGYGQRESREDGKICILVRGEGYLDADAEAQITGYFGTHPDCVWLYTDEDVCTPERTLILPYLKPDDSPETLSSYNYIGNILALRGDPVSVLRGDEQPVESRDAGAAGSLTAGGGDAGVAGALTAGVGDAGAAGPLSAGVGDAGTDDAAEVFYRLAKLLRKKAPACHIRTVLYHYCDTEYEVQGRMYVGTGEVTYRYPVYEIPDGTKIAILIPSKDHPGVLERCVRSIRDKSSFKGYEIIVVDNGSTDENRKRYEELSEVYGYRYHYEPMEFHFSRMCNLAAGLSEADAFLFLNDDTEVITTDWLERLLSQALQPGIGAVGAKLYYPEGDLIQHCGITNMYEGPVHKLFGWSDAKDYDRGRNRGVRNVIGVTAACLMILKGCFEEIGGFPQELAVAYNDVDFCFSLNERGFRNVIRNDVLLTHYESLSRGNDNIDEAKKERLANERTVLYARHPDFYDRDPYYHPALTGASEKYETAVPLENKNLPVVKTLKRCHAVLKESEINETLILKRDHLEECHYAQAGRQRAYLIDLHAHVRGLDSCDYRYRMYLKAEDGSIYDVPAVRRYRPDVEKTYYEQTHVELSGFAIKIAAEALPAGSYEIWMEAKSALSRQRLINRLPSVLKTV